MEIHPTEMSRGVNGHQVNGHQKVIERLTSKIREGAHKAKSLSSACIYRVPGQLRDLNESAYTPRLIAIGPLHRNDPRLQTPMQHVKTSYMNNLLCRMTQGMENQEAEQKKKKILQDCVAAMEKSIDDAKKCYAEEGTLDAEMMLVDGCFILEFLYKYYLWRNDYSMPQGADPIFDNDSTRTAVQHDLVLLENQIPFSVLESLFPLTLAGIPNNPLKNLSLTDYVFLRHISVETSCEQKMNNSSRNGNYHHILHKIHDDFLPHDRTGKGGDMPYMPSASELLYAGVKFVPVKGNNLFKVNFTEPKGRFRWFRSARFEIPFLTIFDSTESYLRNFIALEQCCLSGSDHFKSYALLMDTLVNSDIDVQVLEKAGVIHNRLGASQDVTILFNNLTKGSLTDFFFADQCNRATGYSKRFWPKNMAYLRRQYFASPWKFIAFCLGFVYFGLTIAQLIVSIKIK